MKIIAIIFALAGMLWCSPLRFGIASVAVKDDLYTVKEWVTLLSQRSGTTIKVVFARNYDEIKFLLEKGEVDFAYVCGTTFIEAQKSANIRILAVPFTEGSATYYSLVIAHPESNASSLLDFRGAHYAFSDPKSNSGAVVPTYELHRRGYDHRLFFSKIIYTYDHAESILAVAEGFVQGASVDSVVYENFKNIYPAVAARTKVVERFGPFPITPIVVKNSLDADVQKRLENALIRMHEDARGRQVLGRFGIERFGVLPAYDYSPIGEMIDTLEKERR